MEVDLLKNVIPDPSDCETEKSLELFKDLSEFTFKRVLSESQERKVIYIEGFFPNKPGSAILILEKESFRSEDLPTLFAKENQQVKIFQNDIYSYFRYLPTETFNGIKITAIYPATEKHIQKYLNQPVHIVNETPSLYQNVTHPSLLSEQFTLDWVYNILEHKSEAERIIFEDPDPEIGFILLPDLKWDGVTLETLYLLALPLKRGILSLRDLTSKELPLLNNIYCKGLKAIEEKYSLPPSHLRVYIHYQPSFYHLHVHFNFIQYIAPGITAEKSHLLTTVIDNIKLMSNYYQLATIPFIIKESDKLFSKYKEAGIL